jgi:hypothetical protein
MKTCREAGAPLSMSLVGGCSMCLLLTIINGSPEDEDPVDKIDSLDKVVSSLESFPRLDGGLAMANVLYEN